MDGVEKGKKMSAWKNKLKKSPAVKWLKRLALMLFASIAFTNSSLLLTKQTIATEPAKAALELTLKGEQLYQRGEFDSAATAWQQSANIYQQLGKKQERNQSLINMSEALQANGRYLKACNIVLQAFNIDRFDCRSLTEKNSSDRLFNSWFKNLKAQPSNLAQATGLHSFGDILQKLGRLDLSTRVLQKSLQMTRQLSAPETEAAILLSLGNNQQILGERKQIQEINSKPKNYSPLTCSTQVNDEVIPFYQKAALLYQQAARKLSSPSDRTKVQLNHLRLLQAMGTENEAIALAQQILPKLKELPVESSNIYPRINLAKTLVCLQQSPEEIEPILNTTIQQAQSTGDRRGESYALGYLGWLHEQNQEIPQAVSSTRKALSIAQSLQAQDIAYKWEWQLGHLLEIEQDVPGAIAAYRHAVELLQSLRNDLIGIQGSTRFYFQEQVEPVYRQLVELLLTTQDTSSVKIDNLIQARNTIESLQLVEIENFLQQACLNPKIEIDQIIDREDATAAVIYPIILKQQLAIILKLPQQELRYYSTAIPQKDLENTIEQLQSYLPDVTRTFQVNQLSEEIYELLIRPLENDLQKNQIETLVFVLDSSLRNIPMSVLYDRQQQQYLVEKYAISLAPGLQLVETKATYNSPVKVLAAGISQERLIEGRDFASLINVKQELSQIQSNTSNSAKLLNGQFTKANLQNELGNGSFSVLHLATHGQFSSQLKDTFILAWEQLLKVDDLVNLLQTNYYSNNLNPIQLLVLSACQTAKGDRQAALGLAGITVRAGVSSTMATLWSVDDFSTTQIMNQFYKELNNGIPKAKAIQKAQLAFLNEERRPYFWGSFTLLGNWL